MQQRKAEAEKQAAQQAKTSRAKEEARQAERERDQQKVKDKGLLGGVSGGVPGAIRVGGSVRAPTQVNKVAPVYPAIAQSARVQGIVILEATIGVDGKVIDAKVLRSVPLLDQAAVDAVRQWEYTPTLLNGAPVPVIMTVTVTFNLHPPRQ